MAEDEQSVDIVAESANQALIDAVQKIDAATPTDSGSAPNKEIGIMAAQMFSMAAMATLPASSATAVMSALGVSTALQHRVSAVPSSAKMRQENLLHNSSLKIPADAIDSRGNIIDAAKLEAFTIAGQPVSSAGGGAITAYNVMNGMKLQKMMSFPEVICNMESYGLLQSENEFASPGIADFFAKQGCDVQYLLSGETVDVAEDVSSSVINLSLNESGTINYLTSDVEQVANVFSLHVSRGREWR